MHTNKLLIGFSQKMQLQNIGEDRLTIRDNNNGELYVWQIYVSECTLPYLYD